MITVDDIDRLSDAELNELLSELMFMDAVDAIFLGLVLSTWVYWIML